VHCWADLQSVYGFRCYDNIAPNAKCQQVLVLALWLFCHSALMVRKICCWLFDTFSCDFSCSEFDMLLVFVVAIKCV